MPNPNPMAMYTDFSGFDRMRLEARRDPDGSLRKVAEQFEAIFLQMVLKSMREASVGESLFDSEQSQFYREMFDNQLAMTMAEGGGLGLAQAIVRQLGGRAPRPVTPNGAAPSAPQALAPPLSAEVTEPAAAALFERPADFVRAVWDYARDAAAALGTVPQALVAQAALETGWGRHILPRADGASSNNLFGIKAGPEWRGERVSAATLEHRGGIMARERAAFRAYGSIAESFADYVELLTTKPRYRLALAAGADAEGFASALQRAGYATDPDYAAKIRGILGGDVLREALRALNP